MDGDRNLVVLAHPDQWTRCSHTASALLDGGGVELTWDDDPPAPACDPPTPCAVDEGPGGLAFDRWCRAYRSRPTAGRVELLDDGGFSGLPPEEGVRRPGALRAPRGLAVDRAQRLYVAEAGAAAVFVVDLWAQRALRRVPIRSPRHPSRWPVDVAARCCTAVVLVRRPSGVLLVEGRAGPRPGPALRPPRGAGLSRSLAPTRLAVLDDLVLVLWTAPDGTGAVATPEGEVAARVAGATDVELTADGVLIVARGPGRAFLRFRRSGDTWAEIEPLAAPSHDGGAVAVAPDGRIAFTTSAGLRWTAGSAARHVRSGRVVSYRLDARAYRSRWGRVFVDACIPPGTDVRVAFLTSDDDEVPDPLPWLPADRGAVPIRFPDLTPPLPSRMALLGMPDAGPLYRRPDSAPLPPPSVAGDSGGDGRAGYATYEAPVAAPPGRYLWVVLELTGTVRTTPRVRAVRIESPGHRLGERLPQQWTREEPDADFLHRLLAPAEGLLHELDERGALRAVLLDPTATPREALDWLAGLLGLVLDRGWPEAARRSLVAQAFQLFRLRGTQAALERILRLYLQVPVSVVENWRLRGLGGAVLGAGPGGAPSPAVQGAASSAGALGGFVVGGTTSDNHAFGATAHRFAVLIAADLDAERRTVVRSIVEAHKPAHTLPQICELGDGMRIGRLLHLGLTAVVGPGTGWGPATVGQVFLGSDGVVGQPSIASRLDGTPTIGTVRVG